MKLLVIFITVVILAACCERVKQDVNHENDLQVEVLGQKNQVNDLKVFLQQDPVVLAEKARSVGDMRAMGFSMRSGIVTPGLESYEGELLVVPGTSDIVKGTEHLELLKRFKVFAATYNQNLFSN